MLFDRALLLLILANVCRRHAHRRRVGGATRSGSESLRDGVQSLFIAEYVTRFAVAGERAKYRGTAGRWRFVTSWASIVDLCSFMPWIAEKDYLLGRGQMCPQRRTSGRSRVLRILKTDRFTGAADALGRVFYVNMHILASRDVLAGRMRWTSSLLCGHARGSYCIYTLSLLYYSGDGAEGFESIPATMYLSILMLTGQGEPDGELTTLLKSLCAFTAIFSVAGRPSPRRC